MPPDKKVLTSEVSAQDGDLANLVSAALIFMCEQLAIAWLVAFLSSDGHDFVARNAWPSASRNAVLLPLGCVWLLTLVGVVVMYKRSHSGVLLRLARMLLPVIPISLVPALVVPGYWSAHPLPFLVILGIFGFVAEACFSASARELGGTLFGSSLRFFSNERVRRLVPLLVVIAASMGYVVATGLLTVWKHHGFGTGAYDLAIFDNMMWNAMHGEPYQSSIMYNGGPGNSLAGHAEIAMVLFVPFYAISPSSEALLWIQAVCLGAGAVPLYLLAREFVAAGYAVFVALAYLLYAPLHGSQFYDYHWLTIIPPFLFLAFYGLATRRYKLAFVTTVLLCLLREDVAPGLMVLGLVLVLTRARVKAGLWLASGSAAWFLLVKFAIMPAFGTWFFADLYAELATPTEKGYGSVIKTLTTNPVFVVQKLLAATKLEYLLHILAPVALIPLRRAWLAALLLPGAFFTVFTNWGAAVSIAYQYSAHFTAYVFAGLAVFLGLCSRERRLGATLAVSLTMFCHSTNFGALLQPSSFVGGSIVEFLKKRDAGAERLRGLRKIRGLIPDGASVIATTHDSPHLSARRKIFAFGHSRIHAEYVVIHPDSFGMGSTNQDILAVLGRGQYGLVAQEGQTTLWRQGFESPSSDGALRRLKHQLGDKK